MVLFVFFFFKQKTAYEIGVRLVGSEMCIRDRPVIGTPLNNLMLFASPPKSCVSVEPFCWYRSPVTMDESSGSFIGSKPQRNIEHQQRAHQPQPIDHLHRSGA